MARFVLGLRHRLVPTLKMYKLKKLPGLCLAALFLLCLSPVQAGEDTALDLGFELQVYRTGIIPGVRIERGFARRHAVHFRLGYQRIRHEDFGVHDDERGNGRGFSLGYSWFLKPGGFKGWSFGVRSDLWFNTLDWIDNEGEPDEMSGTTDVVVLQPTVDAAYRWRISDNYFVMPSIAAGFEINVDTDGEDVGEGFILLVGIVAGYSF